MKAPSETPHGRDGDPTRPIVVDWGQLTPLRIHARIVAEGVFAGMHRSRRRGPGVEFGGQRPYVPGDDLRFLDRRSLLKHDRYMVRQFETDTERAVWLCVDGSASMAFRSPEAPGAKLAYGSLVAAAVARIAVGGGDPVGLMWLGGHGRNELRPGSGNITFERIAASLEAAGASGDLSTDVAAVQGCARLLSRRAQRGSVILFVSDLLDLPDPDSRNIIAALGGGSRALVVVQVMDPVERDLSFKGKVRLRAMEGPEIVETDIDTVRAQYLQRLDRHLAEWRRSLEGEGGRLVRACTTDDATAVVRQVVQAVAEAG